MNMQVGEFLRIDKSLKVWFKKITIDKVVISLLKETTPMVSTNVNNTFSSPNFQGKMYQCTMRACLATFFILCYGAKRNKMWV